MLLILSSYFRPHDLAGWAFYLPAISYSSLFSAILMSGMFDYMHCDKNWWSPINAFLVLGALSAIAVLMAYEAVIFAAGCCGFAIIYALVAKADSEKFKSAYDERAEAAAKKVETE